MAAERRIWLALLAAALLTWWLVTHYLVTVTTMSSSSMQPTLSSDLQDPDVVLVDRLSHRLRAPRRGEIVHFQDADGTWIMKRVVALPGEVLELRDQHVWIDGKPLTSPPEVAARRYLPDGYLEGKSRLAVAAGHYFVLGDDTTDSYDSRYWGALPATRVEGLAWAVLWPPARVTDLSLGATATP